MRIFILTGSIIFLSACSNMLFYPMKRHVVDPMEGGIEYEDIYLETADNMKLHGWYLPQSGELKGTLVFFHGNAENISTHTGAVFWLPKHGYQVVVIDYRGYGKSDGKATLDGSIVDIRNSIAFAHDKFAGDKPFIVMGQSIGASMSVFAVATSENRNEINGLVLVAPFSDYRKIARETLAKSWLTWLFQYPLSWTINNDYKPLDYITKINPIPVYLIHGRSDNLIAPWHSEALFERALPPKDLYLIEGGHNDLVKREEFKRVLLKVLQNIQDSELSK